MPEVILNGYTIDIDSWRQRSRDGHVCGIAGCPNEPIIKCDHCGLTYCKDHKACLETPRHSGVKNG